MSVGGRFKKGDYVWYDYVLILDFKESRWWFVSILSHWFQGFFSKPSRADSLLQTQLVTFLFCCSQISIPGAALGTAGYLLKVEQIEKGNSNSDMTGKCQRPFTSYHLRKRRQQRWGGKHSFKADSEETPKVPGKEKTNSTSGWIKRTRATSKGPIRRLHVEESLQFWSEC